MCVTEEGNVYVVRILVGPSIEGVPAATASLRRIRAFSFTCRLSILQIHVSLRPFLSRSQYVLEGTPLTNLFQQIRSRFWFLPFLCMLNGTERVPTSLRR